MIRWSYYPNNFRVPEHLKALVNAFEEEEKFISSDFLQLKSNEVLVCLSKKLEKLEFDVEKSKRKNDIIRIPVLFGECGKEILSFEVDAYNYQTKTVLEVEAGRAYTNHQFLKDFFEACMMMDVDYFCVAVRNDYRGHKDYEAVCSFFEALHASNRLMLPLKGIMVIGY